MVDGCQVVTGLSTAEDWTWPVSGLHPAGGPRTLGGRSRGGVTRGGRTTDGAGDGHGQSRVTAGYFKICLSNLCLVVLHN